MRLVRRRRKLLWLDVRAICAGGREHAGLACGGECGACDCADCQGRGRGRGRAERGAAMGMGWTGKQAAADDGAGKVGLFGNAPEVQDRAGLFDTPPERQVELRRPGFLERLAVAFRGW